MLILAVKYLFHIFFLFLKFFGQLIYILLYFLQFLLKQHLYFLCFNHNCLFTLNHFEIKLFNIFIDLYNFALMNKHHIIDKICHFYSVLTACCTAFNSFFPFLFQLNYADTTILNSTHQIHTIVTYLQAHNA